MVKNLKPQEIVTLNCEDGDIFISASFKHKIPPLIKEHKHLIVNITVEEALSVLFDLYMPCMGHPPIDEDTSLQKPVTVLETTDLETYNFNVIPSDEVNHSVDIKQEIIPNVTNDSLQTGDNISYLNNTDALPNAFPAVAKLFNYEGLGDFTLESVYSDHFLVTDNMSFDKTDQKNEVLAKTDEPVINTVAFGSSSGNDASSLSEKTNHIDNVMCLDDIKPEVTEDCVKIQMPLHDTHNDIQDCTLSNNNDLKSPMLNFASQFANFVKTERIDDSSKKTKKKHIKNKNVGSNRKATIQKVEYNSSVNISCSICQQIFDDKVELSLHMLVHRYEDEYAFVCESNNTQDVTSDRMSLSNTSQSINKRKRKYDDVNDSNSLNQSVVSKKVYRTNSNKKKYQKSAKKSSNKEKRVPLTKSKKTFQMPIDRPRRQKSNSRTTGSADRKVEIKKINSTTTISTNKKSGIQDHKNTKAIVLNSKTKNFKSENALYKGNLLPQKINDTLGLNKDLNKKEKKKNRIEKIESHIVEVEINHVPNSNVSNEDNDEDIKTTNTDQCASKHMKTSSNNIEHNKEYECSFCSRSFEIEWKCMLHKMKCGESVTKRWRNSKCGYISFEADVIQSENKQVLDCKRQPPYVKEPSRKLRQKTSPAEAVSMDATRFSCHLCGRDFFKKWNLNMHVLRCKKKRENLTNQFQSSSTISKRKYNLKKNQYKTNKSVRSRHHKNNQLQTLDIDISNYKRKPIRNGSNFLKSQKDFKHVNNQTNFAKSCAVNYNNQHQKKKSCFQCKICDRVFSYKQSLKVHEMQHMRSQSFVCTCCGNSSSDKKQFKSHLQQHVEATDLPSTAIKNWKQFAHCSTLYTCSLCYKVFLTLSQIGEHWKFHFNKDNSSSHDMNYVVVNGEDKIETVENEQVDNEMDDFIHIQANSGIICNSLSQSNDYSPTLDKNVTETNVIDGIMKNVEESKTKEFKCNGILMNTIPNNDDVSTHSTSCDIDNETIEFLSQEARTKSVTVTLSKCEIPGDESHILSNEHGINSASITGCGTEPNVLGQFTNMLTDIKPCYINLARLTTSDTVKL